MLSQVRPGLRVMVTCGRSAACSVTLALLVLSCGVEHSARLMLQQGRIRMTRRAAAIGGADDLRVAEFEAIAAIRPQGRQC